MAGKQRKENAIVRQLKDAGRGAGKDGPYLAIILGIITDSLNRRYGLGLTEQEILAGATGLVIIATRIKQWLEKEVL